MVRFRLLPRDREFFVLFREAGQNLHDASRMLVEMLRTWPDDSGMGREITRREHEGDRITHDVIRKLNSSVVTPIDREDLYALIARLDDVVDDIEEVSDLIALYKIEAPMEQAIALAEVLLLCCEQVAKALGSLQDFRDLPQYIVEVNRLENEGDRIFRNAVASLFETGVDPMFVIRWKDIFNLLERAIDACENVANILENISVKNA